MHISRWVWWIRNKNNLRRPWRNIKLAISSTSKPTFQYYYRMAEAYASVGQVPQAIELFRRRPIWRAAHPCRNMRTTLWRNCGKEAH